MATFLSLFDHKAREHSKLSRQEVHAITAFLTARVKEFALFETAPSQLRQLVQHSTVLDVDEDCSDSAASDDSVDLLAHIREVWSPLSLLQWCQPQTLQLYAAFGRYALHWSLQHTAACDLRP